MFDFDEILCLEQGKPFCASPPELASGGRVLWVCEIRKSCCETKNGQKHGDTVTKSRTTLLLLQGVFIVTYSLTQDYGVRSVQRKCF